LRVFTPIPAISEERYLHHTFLDSLGRTAVKLRFENLVDEKRGTEIVVVYEYPWFAGFGKVVVVATGVLAIFVLRLVGGRAFKGAIGDE
jgi:oligosaccharyltransferase complex subunit alpha (ribophorin I)